MKADPDREMRRYLAEAEKSRRAASDAKAKADAIRAQRKGRS